MTDPTLKRAALAWALLPAALGAQTSGLVAPSGGHLLQQVEAPARPAPATDVTIDKTSADGTGQTLAPSAAFMLGRLQITHHSIFDTATLHGLVADAEGKNTTLPQLADLAARITHYYRSHGYPLSRAIIPAQSISTSDGVVSIRVVEAHFGQVEVVNSSRVPTPLLQATAAPLATGEHVNDGPLQNVLLLLSDIPGIAVKAIYKPGQSEGSADLILDITHLPMVSGNLAIDNYGNAYTGQERLSSSLSVTNPLQLGDTFNASVLSSGKGLNHWRLAYEATLNGLGSRAGASRSSLDYALGGGFESSQASGSAILQSAWSKHPLVRSPDVNVNAQAQFDRLQSHDRKGESVHQPDRTVQSTTLSLSGDVRSPALQNGSSNWKLAWTGGQLSVNDGTALAGASASHFAKWNLNLAHLQSFSPHSALYLTYTGQRARSNLDPSQKISAGGPYTVRAYAMGAVSGDSADLLSAEWQHTWNAGLHGQWPAVAFVDSARVTVNHTPAVGVNTASLSGAGVGLNWSGAGKWSIRSALASPIGGRSALVRADKSVRAWLEMRRAF